MARNKEGIAGIIHINLYQAEDADIIEYLKGKPKTWLVKEALRFYRDNKDGAALPPASTAVKDDTIPF